MTSPGRTLYPPVSWRSALDTRAGVAFRPWRSGSSPSSSRSDPTRSGIWSPRRGLVLAISECSHNWWVDAIEAAQVLSEIGYLLRQDPEERFRAKAFSAAAWSLAVERPDLASLHKSNGLTSIEGVGPGIAKVLTELMETGHSRYLDRLREQMKQPAQPDESKLDFARYQGDVHSHTNWS